MLLLLDIEVCLCLNSGTLVDGVVIVTDRRDNGNAVTGGCTGLYSLCYLIYIYIYDLGSHCSCVSW